MLKRVQHDSLILVRMTIWCGDDQNPLSLEGRGGRASRVRVKIMGLSLCVGCWRRYTVPLLECHPELVSGSHYSIYPLVFVCEIYEMPKQVRHDNLVWIRHVPPPYIVIARLGKAEAIQYNF